MPGPSRKPSRKLWKGLGLLLAILVLGFLAAIPLVVRHYASAEYVEGRLSDLLGRQVTVARVGLSFRPDLRVRAQGIVLEPDLHVRAVELALKPVPLLSGRLEARRVIFEGVRAELPLDDGTDRPEVQLRAWRLTPLFELPALSFEDSEFTLASTERPNVMIHFDVLSLDPVRPNLPAGLSARGELRTSDSASPFEVEAQLDSIGAEEPLGSQRGAFSLALRNFHATELKAHFADVLGRDWRADPIDLSVEGRYENGSLPDTELSLRLAKGSIRSGAARIDGPGTLRATVSWDGAEAKFRDVVLQTAGVRFRDHRFRSVRTRIDWDGTWLDIGNFSADAYVGSLGLTGSDYRIGRWARPLKLEVKNVDALEMDGRIRFSQATEKGGIPSVEEADVRGLTLRDVRGELDAGSGALLPARVDRVTWESPAEGEKRVLQLEGSVDDGNLRFDARVEAAGPGQEPVYDVVLDVDAMDPSRVRLVWEDFVDAGVVETRVAGKIHIFESPADGFVCDIDLRQHDGITEVFGIRLEEAARFSGRLVKRRDGPMELTDAKARSERVHFEGYEGDEASAAFRWDPSGLTFDRLTFKAYGGAWDLAGTTTLDASPHIRATGFFEDVRIEALRASDGAGGSAMRLGARGDIELVWHPKQRTFETLSGRGDVTVADGATPGQKLLAAVAGGLLKALPVVGRARTMVDPETENPIHHGRGSYEVRNGRLQFDAVELATGDYDLVGTGSLAPSGDLEFRGDLTLTRAGVSKTTQRLTAPVPFKEAFRLPAVPVQLEGSLYDWDSIRARADMKAVPVATLRGIVGLPARAGSIVRDAGKAARRMGEAAAGVVTGGGAAPEGNPKTEEPASGDPEADKQ